MPATPDDIAALRRARRRARALTPAGSGAPKAENGVVSSAPEPINTSTPTSTSSASPSSSSKKRWRKPKTIREFAAQANEIATMVLNDAIDLEKARSYASLARVVSQAASIEVTRSRFLKQEPDLSLESDEEDEDTQPAHAG